MNKTVDAFVEITLKATGRRMDIKGAREGRQFHLCLYGRPTLIVTFQHAPSITYSSPDGRRPYDAYGRCAGSICLQPKTMNPDESPLVNHNSTPQRTR